MYPNGSLKGDMFCLLQHDLPYRSIETCFVVCLLLYLLNRILILVQPQPYSVPKARGGSTLSVVQTEACFVRCRIDYQFVLLLLLLLLLPNGIVIVIVPNGLELVKLSNCIVLVIRICTNLVHNCPLYIRTCVALYQHCPVPVFSIYRGT